MQSMAYRSILSAMGAVFVTLIFNFNGMARTQDVEEFDPFAPDAEEILQLFDEAYEERTGESPFLPEAYEAPWDTWGPWKVPGCYRSSCRIWAHIDKRSQMMSLYIDGVLTSQWAVSTGRAPKTTPNFDTHPDGRVYRRYTSTLYPEGDYRGLGNMPYAVFIRGPFAIHGTPRSNWSQLGRTASHGCIRLHPDHALTFNQLVRSAGRKNVWITVE